MAFIGILIFWAISFVAGQLLRAATTRVQNAKSDDVQRPRTEEGGQIPAIFGTVKLGPTIVWFGDVETIPVKKRIETSIFGTSKKQTIGYKYLVGMQGGLCWGPIDELVDIIVAEKKKLSEVVPINWRGEIAGIVLEFTSSGVTPALPESYTAGGTAFDIDAPFIFGGPEKGGGIDGTLRFYYGSTTQTANAYLATQTATSPFPAYKGLCYAVWEHVDCGQSTRIEPWQFIVRRCPTTLGALVADTSLSRIGDNANPAEIIYELWTDARWGLGESSSALDIGSFTDALQTLSDEGLGISGTHLGSNSADEKIKEILRTIDGVLVSDPFTGKLRLKLIRADYTLADLETFTPSNSSNLTVSRPDWDELTTEIKVRYTDTTQDFTTRARAAYNPAVRQATGIARGVTVDYPLIGTGAAAEAIAVRDLKALSSPLATGSVTTGRVGAVLAPGDPFILDYPDKGLSSTVVRATRVNYGTINGKEAVEIQWTEDVFGVGGGVFVTTPPDQWTPPTPPVFGNVVVIPTLTLNDTEGCVSLEFTGQVERITLIEMRGQVGGETAGAWTTFDIDDPPNLCIARDDRDTGKIAWRVTVTESDATTDTIEGEIEVPPLGADDGNAQGTPGNFFVTMRAGPALIIDAVPAADTRHPEGDTDPVSFSLAKIGALSVECLVLAAGPSGAKVKVRILPFIGGAWQDGPTVDIDAVNTDGAGAIIPQLGATFTVPADLQVDNAILDWVTTGGDGATEAIIGNIYLRPTSSATPPTPTTPPPEIPTDGLFAYWALTEGSGQTVANKSPGVGTADLILGDNTSDGSRDPTWQTGPRRLATAGFATVDHHYAHYDSVPSLVNGCAIFFYGDITSLGGLAKYLCGMEGGSNTDHQIGIDGSNKAFALVSENTGGGTTRTATGTTSIVNGSKHVFGLLHDGTNVNVYVDPADGLPEGTTACGAAFENTTPRKFVIGAGHTPTTLANGPDVWAFGDVTLYAGSSVAGLTPVKIAELYATYKLTYTSLP